MARKATKNVRRGRPSKAAKTLKDLQANLPAPSNTKLTPEQRMAKLLVQKDTDMVAKYPHYIPGSVRLATPEEITGHFKKFVALIKCDCGNTRLVSTSDVFQVKKCMRCASGVDAKVEALKARLQVLEAEQGAVPTQAVA